MLRTVDILGVVTLVTTLAPSPTPYLTDRHVGASSINLPSISAIAPARIDLGTPGATVTVNGANFTRNSSVRVNGSERPTTYVSATQLHVAIPASDLAAAAVHSLTVFNQGGSGGTSNAKSLEVVYPMPGVATLSPTPATLGGEPFTLVVTGTRFYPVSAVLWNNAARPTTFVSPEQVTALIPASDLATGTSAEVRVTNPGAISAPRSLALSLPTPTITSFNPANRRITPGLELRLRVNGQGFVRSGSTVRWNGQPRTTTWVNATQLEASIPYSDIDTAGTARVTVFSSIGGTSKESLAANYEILNPQVQVSGSSPYVLRVGDAGRVVEVTGERFLPGVTTARVNGRSPSGSVMSQSRLAVTVQAQDMDSVGAITVEVTNAPPGGGTDTHSISVINATPSISSVNPANALRGGAAFTLIIRGGRLAHGAVVRWNGGDRPTTRVSISELRASIPATDLTRGGDARITVFNPLPGGGESNALVVTVLEQAIKIP